MDVLSNALFSAGNIPSFVLTTVPLEIHGEIAIVGTRIPKVSKLYPSPPQLKQGMSSGFGTF